MNPNSFCLPATGIKLKEIDYSKESIPSEESIPNDESILIPIL